MKTTTDYRLGRFGHTFHEISGDIFHSTRQIIKENSRGVAIIIPHVCNNVNAFGAGFAEAIARQYPIVKVNFHVNGDQKLGRTQFIETEKIKNNTIIVSNMIAQNGLINKKNKRPLHYPSLIQCMYEIKRYCNNLKDSKDINVEIHSPKFGSGLAGGNWTFISDLIDDIWSDIDTFIYTAKK